MYRFFFVFVLFFITIHSLFSTTFTSNKKGLNAQIAIPISLDSEFHPIVTHSRSNHKYLVSFDYFDLPIQFVTVRFSNPILLDTIGLGTFEIQDTTYKLLQSGTLRTFPIKSFVLSPIQYSGIGTQVTLYQKIDISLEYTSELKELDISDKYSNSIFQLIANYPFIPTKNNLNFSKVQYAYSSGNSVKILTKKDDIVSVSFKDILQYNPKFEGKNISTIFLYHNNTEQFCKIGSTDSIIDQNDVLYFLGKRPIGEQEWVDKQRDQYAHSEAFFLSYEDRRNENSQFSKLNQSYLTQEEVTSVYVEQVFEDYKEYFPGFLRFPGPRDDLSLYPSTRTPGEAQYTSLLSTFNKDNPASYEHSIYFVPSLDITDSLQVLASFIGLNDIHTFSTPQLRIEPNHKAVFQGFKDTIIEEYSAQIEKILPIQLNYENSYFGKNSFKMLSGMPESLNQFMGVTDWQAVNKITLKGKVQPFTFTSTFAFTSQKSTIPKSLLVSGFSNSEIAVLDSNNNSFEIFSGVPGIQVLVSASHNEIQSILDDSLMITNDNFLFTTISKDANSKEILTFQTISLQQVNSFLTNPSLEYVIIAGKNTSNLPSDLKSFLSIQNDNQTFAIEFKNQVRINSVVSSNMASYSEFIKHPNGKKYQVALKIPSDSESKYYLSEISNNNSSIVDSVQHFTLRDNSNKANYLIISHQNFLAQSEELAQFHKDSKNVLTKIVDVEQIYNEFSFGKKSPYAIRNFLNLTLQIWEKAPTYVTLFGDASNDPNKYIPRSVKTDFVPTFGRPSSDFWYVFSDSSRFRTNFYIGRIPAQSSEEASNYVSKVKQYANVPNQQWLKSTHIITGGFNKQELDFNKATSARISDYISGLVFCGQHKSVIRELESNETSYFRQQADTILRNLNNGVLMNFYIAHGASDVFQIAGWEVERLKNFGKYFMLFTGACQTGNFSNSENSCRNETYLVAKDKGSIVSTGITGWGELSTEAKIPTTMIQYLMFDSDGTWGSVFYKAKNLNNFLDSKLDSFDISLTHQFPMAFHSLMQHTFLGDPMVSIPLSKTTDYILTDLEIETPILATTDSIAILKGFIFNKGFNKIPPEIITLIITTVSDDTTRSDTLSFQTRCEAIEFRKELPFYGSIGNYKVYCKIETRNAKEFSSNNLDSITFSVFNLGAIALDPSPFWNLRSNAPNYRFYIPNSSDSMTISCVISKYLDFSNLSKEFIFSENNQTEKGNFIISKNFVTWSPEKKLEVETLYELEINVTRGNSEETLPIKIPFYTSNTMNNSVELNINTQSFQFVSNSKTLEKSNQSYKLPNKNVPIQLLSNGKYINSQGTVVRYRQININDYPIVPLVNNRAISIATMKDTDSTISNLVEFDFYKDSEDTSAFTRFRTFLDTTDTNTYIFLVVSDDNFSGFLTKESTDIRSMDSLRTLLNSFGSRLIDSITLPGTSFVLMGKKGWKPGQGIEKIGIGEDTISISTNLRIQGKSGIITLPSFGPVSQWIEANSVIKNRNSYILNEKFYSKSFGNTTEFSTIRNGDTVQLDVSQPSLLSNPFITSSIEVESNQNLLNDSIVVSSYFHSFLPFTETSVTTSFGNSGPIMRGDSLTLNHTIENHMFRDSNSVYEITFSVRTEDNVEVFKTSNLIESLLPNQSLTVEMTVPTLNFSGNLKGVTTLFPLNKKEFFEFNNTFVNSIGTFEDKVKPTIKIYMDDKEVKSGSVVGNRPMVRVEISDNSSLPLTSSQQRIRINSKIITQNNVEQYSLRSIQNLGNNTLIFEFLSDILQFGEVILQVFAEDGSTNKDTSYFSVFREKNSSISNILVFPQPITNNATLQFFYSGSELFAQCSIEIYNSLGQKIAVQNEKIQLGENRIQLNLRDTELNSLPIGTYFFTLSLVDIFVLNKPFGTFVIIR